LTKLACRAFAVLLLLAGVAIGVHLGLTENGTTPAHKTHELAADDLRDDNQQQEAARDWHARYAQTAASQDAGQKADSLADIATDQAKALDHSYAKAKEDAKKKKESGGGSVDVGPIPDSCKEYGGNRAVGCARMLDAGFGLDQMPCLDKLWNKESGWNVHASNGSGAYGIPQALPGDKMASAGDDWQDNPSTQSKWGLQYISGRYSNPCGAWQHSEDTGWY
jgi:hypothetical protein